MNKLLPVAALLALTACARDGDFDETGGINARRSPCPAVAVPAATGDITLFTVPGREDVGALDLNATVTNVRSSCSTVGDQVVTQATFDVVARRQNAGEAREVTLPYFVVVTQGGSAVVSKKVAGVVVRFEPGQVRGSGRGQGSASVSLVAATLPADIVAKLQRRRKADDPDASIDPLAAPDVRNAVNRATFEMLIGFQLNEAQLRYNATR